VRLAAILPIRDKADLLARCLASVTAAAQQHGDTQVILVDNGSTDGSLAIQTQYADRATLVASTAARVGGVRNDGTRVAHDADVFVFIDCDCEVPPAFFRDVEETFVSSGAAAVGCEVYSPSQGHWSERVWDRLHRPGGDGPRHYINSACFAIRAEWFRRIAGFDATKSSSEDVDICRRLTAAGGTMWQSERLAILHLGNPQTVAGLYRRLRWHGEGIWEPGAPVQWSVSTICLVLFPCVTVAGVVVGVPLLSSHPVWAIVFLLTAPLLVPLLFVIGRAVQFRRRVPVVGGVALMLITFVARLHGVIRAVRRRTGYF
jgi:cellulose synthase/poly-beta-1,6-N-acetylglucosamine synthase-like glycosyltransferase